VTRRIEILIWVGLFAAPVAFASEHIFGWLLSEANCNVAGKQWDIDFTAWVAVVTAVAALVAAAGLTSAVVAYRAVKGTDNDEAPPVGRVWLLAVCGIVVSVLLLVLIVLGGSGALLLGHCRQS
jgi:heme/copper-type cytochrome/quinol oxidase subunit 2